MPDEMFTWTSPAGVEITLPPMNRVKSGVIRKSRKLEPVDAAFTILEALVDEDTLALIDDLETTDLNDLLEKWQAGASVGES